MLCDELAEMSPVHDNDLADRLSSIFSIQCRLPNTNIFLCSYEYSGRVLKR